jgi:hypothetical protein
VEASDRSFTTLPSALEQSPEAESPDPTTGPPLGNLTPPKGAMSERWPSVTCFGSSRDTKQAVCRRARKVGYLVAVLVNGAMLVVVNVRPGWRELSFLTQDFVGILWLINLSMVAGAVVNVAYLLYDPAWFKSVCQVGVSAIGLTAAIRMLRVFPFDFSAYSFDWAALTRLLLVLAVFGSVVAVIVELVLLAHRGISAGVRSQPLHRP